jgi:hypothetical protein
MAFSSTWNLESELVIALFCWYVDVGTYPHGMVVPQMPDDPWLNGV